MDLNLVRVFVAIYETHSLTSAATRLYVTQSAVSQSLGKLRRAFDDQLFERSGRGMAPTPVAIDVYTPMREALENIDGALDNVHAFDPRTSTKTFRVALSELGEIGWLANIVAAVRTQAPTVRIETVPLDQKSLADWLHRGAVDVAIAPADLPGTMVRTAIKDETYCVVMSAQNELSQGPITVDGYLAARHAVVASDAGTPFLAEVERRSDAFVEPAVIAQHFASLPPLLSGDPHLIAMVPRSIAEGWTRVWPLAIQDLPFEMPRIRFHVYCRTTVQGSGALKWFYETVARAVVGSPAQFEAIQVYGPTGVPEDADGSK